MSKYYCNTIPITCSRVLNSSPGRLDLGGLGFKFQSNIWRALGGGAELVEEHAGEHDGAAHPH